MIENEDAFYGLKNILTQFVDIELLLTLFVQINKSESAKDSENKILNTLYLKHTLELIKPLRDILGKFKSKLIKAYYDVIIFHKTHMIVFTFKKFKFIFQALDDEKFHNIKAEIDNIIEEEAKYQKGVLNIRIQKCFAIKVK